MTVIKMYYSILDYVMFTTFLLCFAVGCSSNQPILNKMATVLPEDYCRIAVIPFVNETNFINGDIFFQKVFVAELIKKGEYLISQEGDVRKLFQQIKIYPGHTPDYEQLRIISDRLNVELIITGQINEMSEEILGRGINPTLAVLVQIYDAKTGTCLWSTYHRREGEQYRKLMHFGKINTVASLAQVMSQEMINKWFSEGFKKCVH